MRKKQRNIIAIAFLFSLTLSGALWSKNQFCRIAFNTLIRSTQKLGLFISFDQQYSQNNSLIELKSVKLMSQQLGLNFEIKRVELIPSLQFSWRPIKLTALINDISISRLSQNSETLFENQVATTKDALESKLTILSPFIQFEVNCTKVQIPALKIKDADITASLGAFSNVIDLKANFFIKYHAAIREWYAFNNIHLPEAVASGVLVPSSRDVQLEESFIKLGTLTLNTSGKWDLQSDKWWSELRIPTQKVDKNTLSIIKYWRPEIQGAEGTISLQAYTQGLGLDLRSINSEGSGYLNNLKVSIAHPRTKGDLIANLATEFKISDSIESSTRLSMNLDQLSLQFNNQFIKKSGIALRTEFELIGKNHLFKIKKGEVRVNNLISNVSGSILNGPKVTANITAEIPPTDLAGWDDFFVKPAGKTAGRIEGVFNYEGAVNNWTGADLKVSLSTTNLELPVSRLDLISNHLHVSGQAKVNSKLQLNLKHGAIKAMDSNLQIDLGACRLAFSNLFNKEPGVPTHARILLKGSGNKLALQMNDFNLGGLMFVGGGELSVGHSPEQPFSAAISFEGRSLNLDNVFGRFNTSAKLLFNPWADNLSNSFISGQGSFSISNPKFEKPLFSQSLLNALLKFPQLNFSLNKKFKNVPLNRVAGTFKLENSKFVFTNIKATSPGLSYLLPSLSFDTEKRAAGKGLVLLNRQILNYNVGLTVLRGNDRKVSLPFTVAGYFPQYYLSLDEAFIAEKIRVSGTKPNIATKMSKKQKVLPFKTSLKKQRSLILTN